MHLLDIMDQDRTEANWRFEHLGWAIMALLIAMTVIGFFGDGPLTLAEDRSEDGEKHYTLEYPRWGRMMSNDHMRALVHAPGTEGDEITIAFDSRLSDVLTIRAWIPDTDGGELGTDGGTYVWKVNDCNVTHRVSFEFMTTEPGRHAGDVTIQAGEGPPQRLRFSTFSFP